MLYIISTPIGNLKDISLRALEVLKSVDLIACEDTRHSRKLLSHYNINKPLTSYFEHNKFIKAPQLVRQLREGRNIALLCNAGTPGVSDPGYRLISAAVENGIPITAVPGACALINALVLSGLPSDRFAFEGYLPPKRAARQKRLRALITEPCTLLFYVSPHRLIRVLEDVLTVFGDRRIVLAREMTKMFEEVQRGRISRILAALRTCPPKGEYVLLVAKQPRTGKER
jgi:16S rRNA (cytidine1402-2'-O)-methyltransferase